MKKLLLYLSAFVPMYVLLAVKLVIDLAFGNLSFNVLNSLTLALLVALTLLGVFGLVLSMKNVECNANIIQIQSATNCTDEQFFNYFSLFVLFSLTYQIEFVSMFCVFVAILVFIGLVYVRNNLFNINPLLNILGYSHYEITFTTSQDSTPQNAKVFFRGKLTNGEHRLCPNQKIKNFIIVK